MTDFQLATLITVLVVVIYTPIFVYIVTYPFSEFKKWYKSAKWWEA